MMGKRDLLRLVVLGVVVLLSHKMYEFERKLQHQCAKYASLVAILHLAM